MEVTAQGLVSLERPALGLECWVFGLLTSARPADLQRAVGLGTEFSHTPGESIMNPQ